MTIIKSTACLRNYPYRTLPSNLVKRCMAIEPDSEVKLTTLKLFECYCDLTNTDLTQTSALRPAVLGFVGALSDNDLVISNKDTRNKYARHIINIYNQLSTTERSDLINWTPDLPVLQSSYWKGYPISQSKLVYWQDWTVKTRKKANKYLPFPNVYLSHGEEFALLLHKNIVNFFAMQAKPAQTPFAMMLEYLAENPATYPPVKFKSSLGVWEFFADFRRYFFLRAERIGLAIEAQKKLWNTFTHNVYECLIDSYAWATPYKPLLRADKSQLDPTQSHIKKTSSGKLVRTKLITDIPLYITDEEAIQLLFKDIERDLEVVINWATSETRKIIVAREKRDILAKSGTPITSRVGNLPLDRIGLDNACATLERDGYRFERAYLDFHFGSGVYREDLAELFALPRSAALFPFQCLLVARHPQITPSFLQNFELYNKQGHLSGFVETKSGYQLIGFKDRKGANKSEQKIDLTEETTTLIQELIEITKPLRDYLKNQNNDKWRNLFLSSGGDYAEPNCPPIISWNTANLRYQSTGKQLAEQFAPYTTLRDDNLFDFLKRVSLSTIRASSAVRNYLTHQSTAQACLDLGHTKYNPQLLSSYLPVELLNFCQSRWIRIYQLAIICIAMEGSPYLLRATNFKSMDELHIFLSNHALKDVPEDLSGNEELESVSESQGHAYVSVNPTILSLLTSVQRAVETAPESCRDRICAKARYWASLSKRIVQEIEDGIDQLLKTYLSEALMNPVAIQMNDLIYESP